MALEDQQGRSMQDVLWPGTRLSGLLGWDLDRDTLCLIPQAVCDFSMAAIGAVLNFLARLSKSASLEMG